MKKTHISILSFALILALTSTGCAAKTPVTNQKDDRKNDLIITLLYPTGTTEIEMGQSLKTIIKILDAQQKVVENAQVTLSVIDPDGTSLASIPATFGAGDVYRTEAWNIPHKEREGVWTLTVDARSETSRSSISMNFKVKNSLSETLLNKYGFWVDAPRLKGINPNLMKELGDAQNGAITWGGQLPSQHVLPENWLEVEWREGDFNLNTAQEVYEFLLGTLGNPGFYATRDFTSFTQTKFKNWDAWLVKARGPVKQYDEQWMIFYAPEVNKTYALGTTVALPPTGIDAHAVLRDGFEVHPEIQAKGIAPKPLPHLLHPPELISPEIGIRFMGTTQPITLVWKPVEPLAENEYYLVSIDYNYDEANTTVRYTTRETQFTLPVSLYETPNCGVFNWQVTLMRETGKNKDGQPIGEPVSYNSLYWYVEWHYPPGEEAPFKPFCPNAQF